MPGRELPGRFWLCGGSVIYISGALTLVMSLTLSRAPQICPWPAMTPSQERT